MRRRSGSCSRVGKMLHVIDYLEASDHGLEWYAKVIKDKPYVYWADIYWPHDIEARDFSSDGRTRLAIAESLGLRPSVVVPRGAHRGWYARPCGRCSHASCSMPRSATRASKLSRRTAGPGMRPEGPGRKHPEHSWASSHGADSPGRFAMGYAPDTPLLGPPGTPARPPWQGMTLGRR